MRISDWSSDVCSSDLLNGRAVWSDDHIVGVQVSVDYAAAIAARGRAGEEHPTDRGKGGCTDHASCLQRSGTEIACSAIMQPVFGLGRCDRPLEIPVKIIAGQIGLGFDLAGNVPRLVQAPEEDRKSVV